MNWRDALANLTGEQIFERIIAEQARPCRPAKYKKGDTVQTNYSGFPNSPALTTHVVINVYSKDDGWNGASDHGYALSPIPRGAKYYLDEGWLTPVKQPQRSKS
ncbi:MAG: hypothetical protein BWK73_26840 [Thiothrix lacustris]|uniref:Uncharacterized protein n=1 Tax=Thiothrix lacustris TaxID=525917 RepID=A0A1Y1QKI6_9GAMM|nr:MAG: hypothetical protein BWK73_26840 [Thiothrix lacustris]